MTTAQHARPEVRSGADSLSRMLELEKKYKMQRLQDIGTTPPHATLVRANTRSASSALPNSASMARRASVNPPLSHQIPHMMINTARRSSGLPSLSISVPPRSHSALAMRSDGLDVGSNHEDPPAEPKVNVERTKTVTFSDPEEEDKSDLSDQSSICQSPSWQVYGQNKRSKKREAAQRKKELEHQEKATKNSAKKRLSKAPPPSNLEVRLAVPADRSLSAPELERQQPKETHVKRSTSHYPPDSMTNHHNLPKQAAVDENSKPKSKGLFSSFRFSTSSISTSQKVEDSSRTSMDDTSMHRNGSAFAVKMPMRRGEMDFLNPRKPPSINSNQSSAAPSLSSQDRETSKSRKSFGHGRSHSLLARLKGPSYLYAKSSEHPEETLSSQPSNDPAITHDSPRQLIQDKDDTNQIPIPGSLQSFAHSTTPIARGREAMTHQSKPRNSSSDYEDSMGASSQQRGATQLAPDVPVANESRRRPSTRAKQVRHQYRNMRASTISSSQEVNMENHIDRIRETGRNFPRVNQSSKPASHDVAIFDQPTPTMTSDSDKSYATVYTDAVDQLSERHSPYAEANQSYIRARLPVALSETAKTDNGSSESAGRLYEPRSSRATDQDSRNIGHGDGTKEVRVVKKQITSAIEDPEPNRSVDRTIQQSHIDKETTDYFTLTPEEHPSPSLKIRSSIEDSIVSHLRKQQLDEEPFEEDPTWIDLSESSLEARDDKPTERGRMAQRNSTDSSQGRESCDSPTLSAHDDVAMRIPEITPPIDKTIKDKPSRSGSERSSSSTCNDLLHSPSTATTPDISPPQSLKGTAVEIPQPSSSDSKSGDEKLVRRLHRSKLLSTAHNCSATHDTVSQDSANNTHSGGPNSKIGSCLRSPRLNPTAISEVPESMTEDGAAEDVDSTPKRQSLPPKAQSAIDLPIKSKDRFRENKTTGPSRNRAASSSVSLPSPSPVQMDFEGPVPPRSALKLPRNNSSSSQDSSYVMSSGGAYLQEARKSAPAPGASTRAPRPLYASRTSVPHAKTSKSPELRGEPMAKVLVECCSCHFFHDMPSRVYECMAKPDSIVEDKQLGVSAAITTTVKCPWCAHGMTMECCSGYAAMIYLKEKLHGK